MSLLATCRLAGVLYLHSAGCVPVAPLEFLPGTLQPLWSHSLKLCTCGTLEVASRDPAVTIFTRRKLLTKTWTIINSDCIDNSLLRDVLFVIKNHYSSLLLLLLLFCFVALLYSLVCLDRPISLVHRLILPCVYHRVPVLLTSRVYRYFLSTPI